MFPSNITVITLTYNEEKNLPFLLHSVSDWADDIVVVDSFSVDSTPQIAINSNCRLYQNKFINFSAQRNFALSNIEINTEWILFLDADEWLGDEIKSEISEKINSNPPENGFYLKRRLIWMGTWIKRGYFPSLQLRLFRNGFGRCEDRVINEHFLIQGSVGVLESYFTDENRNGIFAWTHKHNQYSTAEALELTLATDSTSPTQVLCSFWGSQAERRRWLRYKIWNKLPPLFRPFLYFFYRFILRGGFLDGRIAFIFHVLQAFWYPFLIDVKFIEAKYLDKRSSKALDKREPL